MNHTKVELTDEELDRVIDNPMDPSVDRQLAILVCTLGMRGASREEKRKQLRYYLIACTQ